MNEKYQQLMLFPESHEITMRNRQKEFEEKIVDRLTRQQKCQFAKIGALQKNYDDLKHEFETLKASICKNSLPHIPQCEIVELQTRKVL